MLSSLEKVDRRQENDLQPWQRVWASRANNVALNSGKLGVGTSAAG